MSCCVYLLIFVRNTFYQRKGRHLYLNLKHYCLIRLRLSVIQKAVWVGQCLYDRVGIELC